MPGNRRMFWNVRATLARRAISKSGIRSSRNRAPPAVLRQRRPEAVGVVGAPSCVREGVAGLGRWVEAANRVDPGGRAGVGGADAGCAATPPPQNATPADTNHPTKESGGVVNRKPPPPTSPHLV